MLYGLIALAALTGVGLAALLDDGDGHNDDDSGVPDVVDDPGDPGETDGPDFDFYPDGVDDDTAEPVIADSRVSVLEDGTVSITLEPHETGSLVAIKDVYYDQHYDSDLKKIVNSNDYSLSFYLLPAGQTIPIDPDGSDINGMSTEEYLSSLNATKLVSFDLGGYENSDLGTFENGYDYNSNDTIRDDDHRIEMPRIDANADYDIFRIDSINYYSRGVETPRVWGVQPDETLSPFEPETKHFYDALETHIDKSQSGTPNGDYFTVTNNTDGEIVVFGRGGDDLLVAASENIKLGGGDGNDELVALESNVTLVGGNGYNVLSALKSNTILKGGDEGNHFNAVADDVDIFGGDSNDWITIYGVERYWARFDQDSAPHTPGANPTVAYGGDGDDKFLQTYDSPDFNPTNHDIVDYGVVEFYGEDGDDLFSLISPESTADGGAGDDYFWMWPGTKAVGGSGDDRFHVRISDTDASDFATNGPAQIETGDGSDFIAVDLGDWIKAGEVNYAARISDFDIEKDSFHIHDYVYYDDDYVKDDTAWAVSDAVVEVAPDQSYSLVKATVERQGYEDAEIVIQLDGVTELTTDMLTKYTNYSGKTFTDARFGDLYGKYLLYDIYGTQRMS